MTDRNKNLKDHILRNGIRVKGITDKDALHAAEWARQRCAEGMEHGVGACIVSPDGRQFFTGYSRFPIALNTRRKHMDDLEYRDDHLIHAEVDAIMNAKQSVEGWTLYSTWELCSNCATLAIHAGIKRVVAPTFDEKDNRWYPKVIKGRRALLRAKVKIDRLPTKRN